MSNINQLLQFKAGIETAAYSLALAILIWFVCAKIYRAIRRQIRYHKQLHDDLHDLQMQIWELQEKKKTQPRKKNLPF